MHKRVELLKSRNFAVQQDFVLNVLHHSGADVTAGLPDAHGECKPSIMFLHSWCGSARTFEPVMKMLALQCSEVDTFAISYRGHGKSERPRRDKDPVSYGVGAFTQDLIHILRIHRETLVPSGKLIICAHGASSKVTYELLWQLEVERAQRPKEPPVVVVDILLLAPVPPASVPVSRKEVDESFAGYSYSSVFDLVQNRLTNGRLDKEQLSKMIDDCLDTSDGARRGWLEYVTQANLIPRIGGLSAVARCGKWWRPTFNVLRGEHDQMANEDDICEGTVRVLIGHGFVALCSVVFDSGHLIPVEAPAYVVQQLVQILGISQSIV